MVEKNKRLVRWKTAIGTVMIIILTVIIFAFSILIIRGDWGITSCMAAGKQWQDNICIKENDYHIYLITGVRNFGYGDMIDGFKPVKKNFYGWTVNNKAYSYREVYIDNEYSGILYTFKGEDCYYNIFVVAIITSQDGSYEYPKCLLEEIKTVTVGDKECDVLYNGYFKTEERFDYFIINGSEAYVHPGIVPYDDNYDRYTN